MGTSKVNGTAGSGYAYYVLAVLIAICILNWIDRMILSILLVPIQAELRVSDTAMGLLTGFGFTVFYALTTIPIARYSDRSNRRNLLTFAVAFWSLATAVCGVVQNYWQLLIGRAGVGVGEAAGGAPVYSLISDYFPPNRRAFALGLYSSSIFIGIMLSLFLGSLMAERFGWRATFLLLGPPGLLLALLLRFTVREPERGRFEPPATRGEQPARTVLRFLASQRAYVCALGGLTITAITNGAFSAWAPAFLVRVHGLSLGEVGLYLGLVLGLFGALGTISGGYISDRFAGGSARAKLVFPAIVALLMTPALLIFCNAQHLGLAMAAYAAAMIVSGMYFGPAFALTQNLAQPAMRGLSSALAILATAVTGQGLGPVLGGMLNDALAPTYQAEAVRYSLMIMSAFSALGGLIFLAGAGRVQRDLERAIGSAD